MMQKETFSEHLIKATECSVTFAKQYVWNPLPGPFLYIVLLNQSYDGNPLRPGEHVFPNDLEGFGERVGPLSTSQAVELLWRNGLVPEWIDVSVHRTDGRHTFMELLCCGRFTDRGAYLYYAMTDACPFGCKGPMMPPGWKCGDKPFDLNWWTVGGDREECDGDHGELTPPSR